jgi:hypothetical protein
MQSTVMSSPWESCKFLCDSATPYHSDHRNAVTFYPVSVCGSILREYRVNTFPLSALTAPRDLSDHTLHEDRFPLFGPERDACRNGITKTPYRPSIRSSIDLRFISPHFRTSISTRSGQGHFDNPGKASSINE